MPFLAAFVTALSGSPLLGEQNHNIRGWLWFFLLKHRSEMTLTARYKRREDTSTTELSVKVSGLETPRLYISPF